MDIKTKIKTFAATVAMGAITHLVTTQSAVIQQKLGAFFRSTKIRRSVSRESS